MNQNTPPAVGIFTAVAGGVFWFTGLYRGVWRYASMSDMLAITRAVTLVILIFLLVAVAGPALVIYVLPTPDTAMGGGTVIEN